MLIQDKASMTTGSKLEATIVCILEGYLTELASLQQQFMTLHDERKKKDLFNRKITYRRFVVHALSRYLRQSRLSL
jgi:hypothetical protein